MPGKGKGVVTVGLQVGDIKVGRVVAYGVVRLPAAEDQRSDPAGSRVLGRDAQLGAGDLHVVEARVVKRCGITDSACRSQVPFAADV